MHWEYLSNIGMNNLQVREGILSKGPVEVREGVTNSNGPVDVVNANLNVNGNNVNGVDDIKGADDLLSLITSGTGTGNARIYDLANSQVLFRANEGGPVEVLNAALDMTSSGNPIKWTNVDGTQKAFVGQNSSGEIKAEDDHGNSTTLT